MFVGNKWERQTAIVVLVNAAARIGFYFSGIEEVHSYLAALAITALIIFAIHRSDENKMFKGENWKKDAEVTLVLLAIASLLTSYFFPLTLIIMHGLVWFVRKKTGGDKPHMPASDGIKVGSPF